MSTPKKPGTIPTTNEIAAMASRGEDVSRYFTNNFTVIRPVMDQLADDVPAGGPERGSKPDA
ncbi:MAG TPA: hypothetical protein VNX18_12660 [Bryobacteraceae bacterium]|jgi:hypothetical protein|nr:hypothetical protein [Bryobacteraceae bacterium]